MNKAHSSRPYVLSETNWKVIKDSKYDVAILPWGATEAHNYHLPYGTDNFESTFFATESARKAWDKNTKVMVLPTVPFGVNTGQMDIPFVLNIYPSTQAAILEDIVESLTENNINKLIILNSHGGNELKPLIREVQSKYSETKIILINWWAKIVDATEYFDEPGDHAGELETSVMLNIAPELVLPLTEAGNGKANSFNIEGLRMGWAWTQREWTSVTNDTGVGNPYKATKEKGQQYIEAVTNKISEFIIDFANTDNLYE